MNIPCAGCVVFRGNEVCLISTRRGVFGFPKGTRNPGEDLMACALRELQEETGIRPNQIRPLEVNRYVDELNRKGTKISIRLFITELLDDNVKLTPIDLKEIASCEFVPIETAMDRLMKKRQAVLTTAQTLM